MDMLAITLGSTSMREYRSMKALAMPSSSRIADDRLSACLCEKSPMMREERSATSCSTRAISSWLAAFAAAFAAAFSDGLTGCIPHDAIGADRAARAARVVQVMQMGYRLAHREEGLVQVERPAKQHAEQVCRAARAAAQRLQQLLEALGVVRFELGHAGVRAAKRLAVRGQYQHARRQRAVARHRGEKQAERVALRIDRPDAYVGGDRGQQHVARDQR